MLIIYPFSDVGNGYMDNMQPRQDVGIGGVEDGESSMDTYIDIK